MNDQSPPNPTSPKVEEMPNEGAANSSAVLPLSPSVLGTKAARRVVRTTTIPIAEALQALRWLLRRHGNAEHLAVVLGVPWQTVSSWQAGRNLLTATARALVIRVAIDEGWKRPIPQNLADANLQAA